MDISEFLSSELDAMLRFARVLVGDRGTAEDVVQDVAERLLSRPHVLASARDPGAYVRRMIVNRYLSWGRKWFRIQPLELPALPAGDAHDPSVVVADRDLLRAALARLPRNQRAVLVMRYYLRLEDLDIADALGCSPATVRTYASRALAAVRALEPDPRDGSDHAPIHR